MKEKIKKILEKKSFHYFLIVFFSSFICIPLLSKTINLYQDDGVQHICRLMGTMQSIEENPVFPVIMSNFCNGFGYSWNLFYSIATAYVPLLFKLFGASYVGCIKLFIYAITILSGFTMYEFTKRVTKKPNTALLAAIFYILLPYRLTDMYMRIAIAELASFIFLPMVFHGIYAIFEDSQKDEQEKKPMSLILIVGTVGLFLTHTVITLYTAIFAFLYLILQCRRINRKVILRLGISLLIVLLLTAFFWVPLLEHKMATEYEVFQEGRMSRVDVLAYYKLSFSQLLFTQNGGRIFEIGLLLIIGSIFAVRAIYKEKLNQTEQNHTIFFLILGIVCTFLTLRIFPFEKLPDLLCMIQFTFRFLEFIGFFLSFTAAIGFTYLFRKFAITDVLIYGIIAFLLLVPLNRLMDYVEHGWTEDMLWPAFPVTEQTGRVHAGCASFEYLPTKAFENRTYLVEREDRTYCLKGLAKIEEEKNGTNLKMELQPETKELTLELPYIYYLGYEVKIKGEEDAEEEWERVSIQESENGFLSINLSNLNQEETYLLEVSYHGTTAMKISYGVSVISFMALVGYWLFTKKKVLKEKQTKI